MVIGGTLGKQWLGIQGHLFLREGTSSHSLLLPYTYALFLEERGCATCHQIPLPHLQQGSLYFPFEHPSLKLKIVRACEHAERRWDTWIKQGRIDIRGFPHLPLKEWQPSTPLPTPTVHLYRHQTHFVPLSLRALTTSSLSDAIRQSYLDGLSLIFTPHPSLSKEPFIFPLYKALETPLTWNNFLYHFVLLLPDTLEVTQSPLLRISWQQMGSEETHEIIIALNGTDALINQAASFPLWQPLPFTIDLQRESPSLLILTSDEEKGAFYAFDTCGRFFSYPFSSTTLSNCFSYEEGFGGYESDVSLPLFPFPTDRQTKEAAHAHALTEQLHTLLANGSPPLSPPLALFSAACQQAQCDRVSAFIHFLQQWKNSPHSLFSAHHSSSRDLDSILLHLNWSEVSEEEWQQIQQITRWGAREESVLSTISSPLVREGHLLSAYFLLYGIDPRFLSSSLSQQENEFDVIIRYLYSVHSIATPSPLTLYTGVRPRFAPLPLSIKQEEQRPGITLEVSQRGEQPEFIHLLYDPAALEEKWPIIGGRYLIRFQPLLQPLPYSLYLQNARLIPYPHSSQIYSYESDITLMSSDAMPLQQTLSMNRVYETSHGHRLYLAGISRSPQPGKAYAKLVINYDPVKHYLTYPGAYCLFIGSALLFYRSYKRQSKGVI